VGACRGVSGVCWVGAGAGARHGVSGACGVGAGAGVCRGVLAVCGVGAGTRRGVPAGVASTGSYTWPSFQDAWQARQCQLRLKLMWWHRPHAQSPGCVEAGHATGGGRRMLNCLPASLPAKVGPCAPSDAPPVPGRRCAGGRRHFRTLARPSKSRSVPRQIGCKAALTSASPSRIKSCSLMMRTQRPQTPQRAVPPAHITVSATASGGGSTPGPPAIVMSVSSFPHL